MSQPSKLPLCTAIFTEPAVANFSLLTVSVSRLLTALSAALSNG